jgi:hypothetical protein
MTEWSFSSGGHYPLRSSNVTGNGGPSIRLLERKPPHLRANASVPFGHSTDAIFRYFLRYFLDSTGRIFLRFRGPFTARLRLDIQNSSHSCRRTPRRHHPNPAEAHRRWRGERSKPIRLGIRVHTHALFAGKVQRKVRNGVADLAAAGSSPGSASCSVTRIIFGYAEIAPIRARALAMQLHDDVRVRTRFILISGTKAILWTFRSSNPITQASWTARP